MTENEQGNSKVRIDKWLWAARFFKTRSLAKAAIEGGKVQLAGQQVKVSREVVPGDILRIRQGWDEREVTVMATSEQRRAAPIAQTLYEETEASVDRRARAVVDVHRVVRQRRRTGVGDAWQQRVEFQHSICFEVGMDAT